MLVIDVRKPVLKSKDVSIPSAPPAPSSEPPKVAKVPSTEVSKVVPARKKRKRKPRPEEVLQADQRRMYKLYSETVSHYGATLNQLSRIR
jgi:hypothetical protein